MTKNISVQIPRQNRAFFNGISKDLNLFYLGDLGFFRKGKGISNNNLLETGHPCVTYGMLYTKYHGRITKIHSFVNQEISENCEQSVYGEILFPGSGETIEEIGKASVNLIDDPICVGGDTIIFKCDKRVDPMFLSYLLNSNIYFIQTRRLGQGYSVVHIYADDLKEIIIPLPPLPEQKKIAEILSTWDEAIELKNREIHEFESAKESIFKSIVKVDFPSATLGQMVDDKSLKVITQSLLLPFDGEKTYLSTSSIDGNSIISNEGYITLNNRPSRAQLPAIKNSVWFAKMQNSVKVYHFLKDENYILSTGFFGFIPNEKTISGRYLNQIFLSKWFNGKKDMLCEGSSQSGLKNSHLHDLNIPLPEYDRQLSIAETLDTLDSYVQLSNQIVSQLIKQKQGLMQRLLTGKVLVKLD